MRRRAIRIMGGMETGSVGISRVFAGMPDVDAVRRLEEGMRALVGRGEPEVNLLTKMLIHGRMCARSIFMPAGTLLTGALLRRDNIFIVFGDVEVTTDGGVKRLQGMNVIPASAGFKRVVIALADSYLVTIHHTDLLDVTEVENEMTEEADRLQTRRTGYIEEVRQ